MRLKYLFILLFSFVALQSTVAQLSTKHYIPPITTSDVIGAQYIYISTPRNQDIPFTITPVGGTPFNGIVSNTNSYELLFGFGDNSQLHQLSFQTSTVLDNKGYIIEAEDVIYVSVRVRSNTLVHAGALVSKGLSALGTEFRVGGLVREGGLVANGSHLTFASVMATENNTFITFDDIPPGATINNYGGAIPFNISLDEGESYIISIQSNGGTGGDPNDLIGASIVSNKPVVVNSGTASGSSTDGNVFNGRDYGIDQIAGFSKVGSEYVFVRGDGANNVENILIIAHQDNTSISINGNASITTINAGDHYVIEGGSYNVLGSNMYVQTSNPVFAYQGIGGQFNQAPNQGMFFVPPLSCESRGDVNNIATIEEIGTPVEDGGVTIVTNTGSTVTINGDPITNFAVAGPSSVLGNPNYVTYKVRNLTGNVSVQSTGELYCAYFNRDGFAASGSFYSGFPSPPEITFNATVSTLGNCIPNVSLEALNTTLFDSFEWYFDSGSGFTATGNTNPTITPTQAGNYKLIATISCSGSMFESKAVPVSICPDDLDDDLIIDNVDVDLDNDGITNCDESRGNVDIDLTDLTNPILNFIDGSTDAAYITPALLQGKAPSTLVGDNTGNFVTTLDPAFNNQLDYILDLNQPSNIEFTQDTNILHNIVVGETFSLIVGPSTKNITLLDPDNILLVDTNFDDIFEEGVNNFSASEVRFRLNPTPNGTTPFRLVASEVDQVTFRHTLNNLVDGSSFAGNLKLTCFSRDSDSDGIPDSLDADSDNDGIPDLIEASGQVIVLSGVDTDLDGLDDVFASGPVTPVDTDNDGILDYLDFDSDNDGIYDLFEAGHGLADANLDGQIDNAISSVGDNGLVDALETVADNFILAYVVANPDADVALSYIDFDSDGDACSDVIEAGFIDGDNDDIIGTSPVTVDANGKVTGIPDGYTTPNANYSVSAPITLNTPFIDVAFCEGSTSSITIDSTADTFQWEISTDSGTNWANIVNDATYSGATTNTLQISNITLAFNNYQYRVFQQRTGNSCDDTSTPITLTIEPLPIVNATAELRQCDDDNDGFSDFNLNEVASDISANYMNETFVFYETLADAQNGATGIIANPIAFTNRVVTTDTVWARTISAFGCFSITEVTLIVSATAITAPGPLTRNFEACDDFLDTNGVDNANNDDTDGISEFDFSIFSNLTTDIIASLPATQQLIVTYYRNEADALAEQNAIDHTVNYRNIGYPNTQQIYVRVDSQLNNDCIGLAPLITLTVDPIPEANPVNDLELCDDLDDGDAFNGRVQTFDLDSQTATILGTQNPADFTVTYYTSAADANSGTNAITTTSAYENIVINIQTIYVRVTNNVTGCFTDHTTFDLIVHPLPVANFVADLEICDDDSDGSARNGFSQNFDLTLQTATILGTQDPNQFTVTYHTSLANAQAGLTPLSSPFSNSVAFAQTIYVRVFNNVLQCANGISNFRVIVNQEPIAENVSNLSYCDDDADGNDANGFVQNIDLDSQIPGILGATQDEDDFTVTFHETQADATSGANALSSPYSNTTANQQTIYVRVLNDDTGCFNDDFTFDIIVNPLPSFTVTTPQIVCLNGPPLTIMIENPAAVYDVVWTDPNGNTIVGSQITITTGGLYSVTATTTDGTSCGRTRTIQVNESIIATITEDDVTIVDDSDNNSITIDPTNLGVGDYEYALRNEDGITTPYQDSPVFENLPGGFYTILVQDKNGCGIAQLEVSVVEFPKFFTPNNDGVKDTWEIKGANSTLFPGSMISIFNRFGKIVAKIDIDGPGWDGTFNGKTLPSDDYWFSIELIDRNGVMRNRKGNFSLLRK